MDADERHDFRFLIDVAGYAVVSTKLGGDEIVGTAGDAGGDGRTETTTVGDTETNFNEKEVHTADSEVKVVTDVSKNRRSHRRRSTNSRTNS